MWPTTKDKHGTTWIHPKAWWCFSKCMRKMKEEVNNSNTQRKCWLSTIFGKMSQVYNSLISVCIHSSPFKLFCFIVMTLPILSNKNELGSHRSRLNLYLQWVIFLEAQQDWQAQCLIKTRRISLRFKCKAYVTTSWIHCLKFH